MRVIPRGHVLYVAFRKANGRSGLHRVEIPPMHGSDIRSGKDVEHALQDCSNAGLCPTGAVFSEQDLLGAVADARQHSSQNKDKLAEIDRVYSSIDSASQEYRQSSQVMDEQISELYGRIGSAIARYVCDVLPPRSVTAFGVRAGLTAPTMNRVLAQQKLTDDIRGVRWANIARTLHTMGVLEDVADVVDTHVDSLAECRLQLASREEAS